MNDPESYHRNRARSDHYRRLHFSAGPQKEE